MVTQNAGQFNKGEQQTENTPTNEGALTTAEQMLIAAFRGGLRGDALLAYVEGQREDWPPKAAKLEHRRQGRAICAVFAMLGIINDSNPEALEIAAEVAASVLDIGYTG